MSMLALAAVVFLAFVSEAMAGFGATIITVTLAAHLMPVHEILALFLPVNVLMSLWLVLRNGSHIDGAMLGRRILPWMGAGLVAGLALAGLGDELSLKAAFGALVVVLAGFELVRIVRIEALPSPLSRPRAALALLAAGLIHGVFATGGPLVVWVMGREIADKARFRATLSALWLVLNGVMVATYLRAGTVTAETLRSSAALLIPLVLGAIVGEHLHRRLPIRQFRLCVFLLLAFAGVSLLVRTLLAMFAS